MSSSCDQRIDAYIAKAQPFARPILEHLRQCVHEACPDIEETLKWSAPAYTLRGKIVCITASFKAHCAVSFWAKEMEAVLAAEGIGAREGMGNLGKVTSLEDLPAKAKLKRFIKQAAEFAIAPPSGRPPPRTVRPAPPTPPELSAALAQKQHAKAAATWKDASPSMKREYIEWITEAKQEATRARRLATTLEWLAQGKSRNWKYQNC